TGRDGEAETHRAVRERTGTGISQVIHANTGRSETPEVCGGKELRASSDSGASCGQRYSDHPAYARAGRESIGVESRGGRRRGDAGTGSLGKVSGAGESVTGQAVGLRPSHRCVIRAGWRSGGVYR